MINNHPMDDIPVRRLRFDLDNESQRDPVWSRSCPEFAIFINALGVDVPHFERFLVKVMREYRDELQDDNLVADVKAIIGQESHHAFNFAKWTAQMTQKYPELQALDDKTKEHFADLLKTKDKKYLVGFTAGYETFTFLGGLIILQRYDEFMKDADPVLRAMWVWHQVEEVEHGAVAYDFYKTFFPTSEWYRKYMVVYAFKHIIWETFKSYRHMIKVEGYYSSPKKAFRAWRFFLSFGGALAWSAIPVLKKSYHPREHPICTTGQNKIAVAWRKRYESGADNHVLDDEIMSMMQEPRPVSS